MGVPGSSFTDIDSGTSEVIAEALIMLEKPAKFEFAHRLLGGALHGGLGALNNDRSIIGFFWQTLDVDCASNTASALTLV